MTAPCPRSLPQTHLRPGELLVTTEPQVVTTVLGSCVAVTMFDRESGLASICHAMLSRPPGGQPLSPDAPERFRYVDEAVPAMLDAYRRARVGLERLEVKVFGGGSVMVAEACHATPAVGAGNVATAKAILRDARMSIKAENTGGHRGRKILFNTATGEVLHKHLSHPAR